MPSPYTISRRPPSGAYFALRSKPRVKSSIAWVVANTARGRDGTIAANRMLIFSYGSNLCSARLHARAPSARARGTATLAGYQLRFHKRSVDGSAKADAFRTDDPHDLVWGVVYEIADADKPELDAAEGRGGGYADAQVTVRHAGAATAVQIYLARATAIAPELQPYTWYTRYVIAGAIEHALPAAYVDRIRAVAAIRDPDPARQAREWIALP